MKVKPCFGWASASFLCKFLAEFLHADIALMDDAQVLSNVLATVVAAVLLLRFFRLVREGRKHVADLEGRRLDRLRSKGA